jgi:hypothetical protein
MSEQSTLDTTFTTFFAKGNAVKTSIEARIIDVQNKRAENALNAVYTEFIKNKTIHKDIEEVINKPYIPKINLEFVEEKKQKEPETQAANTAPSSLETVAQVLIDANHAVDDYFKRTSESINKTLEESAKSTSAALVNSYKETTEGISKAWTNTTSSISSFFGYK